MVDDILFKLIKLTSHLELYNFGLDVPMVKWIPFLPSLS